MSAQYKRTTFLVKKGLQFRYMGVIILSMLAVSAVVGWTIYYTVWTQISDPNITLDLLAEVFHRTNGQLMYSIGALILFIGLASIFVSHKIAGPVYRFEQSVKSITEGDLTLRIKLRKGDEMTELADMFNHMTATVEGFVSRGKIHTARLREVVTRLQKGEKVDQATIGTLSEILGDLETVTSEFTIGKSSASAGAQQEDGRVE